MLELLTQMGWPASVAIVGCAWAIGAPIMVRRRLRNVERIKELELKRAIQLESFKKGALTHMEEHDG